MLADADPARLARAHAMRPRPVQGFLERVRRCPHAACAHLAQGHELADVVVAPRQLGVLEVDQDLARPLRRLLSARTLRQPLNTCAWACAMYGDAWRAPCRGRCIGRDLWMVASWTDGGALQVSML